MTTLEIILTVITSSSFIANIVQFFTLKSTRKKAGADAAKAFDEVLLKRIDFLDARITKLEEVACFDRDCKFRK